ncbi:unnamed protein product [Enterobius vermicularis]|uniref:phenylalanine--tRNA ligase n=1 Tax=Enterobius vermicularis TaxID=51028 RepID=A0A0N4V9U5_ENTVE|nr:unnamed protein product [Enterobius vermicularis]
MKVVDSLSAEGDCVSPEFILKELEKHESFETLELSSRLGVDHQKIVGAIKSLLAQDGLIVAEEYVTKRVELSSEGKAMSENGSHEANVFLRIGKEGAVQSDIMARCLNLLFYLDKLPYGKVGISKALAAGWIFVDKSSGNVRLFRKIDEIEDTVKRDLKRITSGRIADLNPKTIQEFKKRKLLSETNIKSYKVKKGHRFTTVLEKPEVDLTADMIANGSWRTKQFKKYNFEAFGIMPSGGHLHPLMKVRNEFRQIFFQMGFSEMPTNRYVESSFWNFDALFQPQQHPARDAHDTFFVSDPANSFNFPEDYLERVKTVHSKGGYGSKGYNYEWKLEEAQKNVLRTHTTAVSARQLYKLAQNNFRPVKLFSIDRVFRNETLDATHLAEFHQVEGVIAERNLSLAHVMGLFTEFFRKCGIRNLRFKPTYNPYTEPSMEVFAFHKGLKKWVEIGNSGMFRPEMLLPMGLPPDVNVAGYGLSLERPTMIRYGLNNIRDLFGSKVDLEVIYNSPICRLDKV